LGLKVKQYKRVITFGCSWTKYFWPTWANVISDILEVPLVNQGTAGIGNVAILHKMLAWDLQHGFSDTDLVLVNWSTFFREDRIKNGHWRTGGSVFNSRFYNDKFVRNYWDGENDFVRNAGAIIMANKLFSIAYQSRMPQKTKNGYKPQKDAVWYQKWHSKISHIEAFWLTTDDLEIAWKKLTTDEHPSILSHTDHAIKIAKDIGFNDTDKLDSIKEYYNILHDNITNDLKLIQPIKDFDAALKIIPIAVLQNLKKLKRPLDFQGHDKNLVSSIQYLEKQKGQSWHDL
jgi:hypothetical protein|tara:strand:- start:46 stop:909 length:864 start_codon:yes stop_codon:yes gene_type:complete